MAAKLRALQTPQELLCIAIDGSDQSSYSVPYFKQVRAFFSSASCFDLIFQRVCSKRALCSLKILNPSLKVCTSSRQCFFTRYFRVLL